MIKKFLGPVALASAALAGFGAVPASAQDYGRDGYRQPYSHGGITLSFGSPGYDDRYDRDDRRYEQPRYDRYDDQDESWEARRRWQQHERWERARARQEYWRHAHGDRRRWHRDDDD